MSEINITINRWVAMNKQGLVLCEYNPNPNLSYHLGDLRFEILGDFCDVISGTRKLEIMEHIKKWNKECRNNKIAKCKAVKIRIVIEGGKK
jgi:hypothetical protein